MKPKRTVRKGRKADSLKINKNYTSMEHYRAIRAHIGLSRLTYGIIDGYEVEYIETDGSVIEIKDSWIELILFMIANVIENNPKDFLHLLSVNGVTSPSLVISKSYGKVSFDKNRQYQVYKLYDTDYYVEAVFDIPVMFSAICGLMKICSMTNDKIEFGIVSKNWIEKKIDFNILDKDESIAGPGSIADMKKMGMQIVEISILDERVGVHSVNGVLWVFCVEVHKRFGDEWIKKLPKYKSTGVSKTLDRDDVRYMQLPDSEYFVYTDLDYAGIAKFIAKSSERLGLEDRIKFKYRKIIK